ncbi:MAG: amidinotransferase, partial [Ekhidna sp.]|nr:amidinotransferase [Ekhidna sp.]
DGRIITYPMYAENRRLERRDDVIEKLKEDFQVDSVQSLASWESQGKFLEGTGSMILDRSNKIAYASISDRTNEEVLADFCKVTGYDTVSFTAYQTVDQKRLPIYHTNVMMALGENYAVVCLAAIDDEGERKRLIASLEDTGKGIIEISEAQMHHFAGNMLQVINDDGEKFTVMSQAAFDSLRMDQISTFEKYGSIISSAIPTIEKLGGGSVRCMMAEVFLPKK